MRPTFLLSFRCLLLVIFTVLRVHVAVGQKIDVPELYNRQTLFWELGGHARGMLSANYERLFKGPFKHSLWTLRTGFGFMPAEQQETPHTPAVYSIPVVGSLLVGRKHMVGLSVGWTASFSQNAVDSSILPHVVYQKFEAAYMVTLAYRFMRYDHVMVMAGPTFVVVNNPDRYQWSYMIGVGYTF